MHSVININKFDLLTVFSNTLDLISPLVSGHQIRVSYIAFRIAKEYGLSDERITQLVIAGFLHDIGATTVKEREEIIRPDFESDGRHEKVGAHYLQKGVFKDSAIIVRHHHRAWNYGKGEIYNNEKLPIECQILHLADRIETYINKSEYVLWQREEILNKIKENSGILFVPELVKAFERLSVNESFWLYIVSRNITDVIFEQAKFDNIELNIDELYDITKWFSNIIDFRSRFTAVHSRGVSKSAATIAEILGLDSELVTKIEIAGFLHDLGKLAIPNTILEKQGTLNTSEYDIIRSHTFNTYNILSQIKQPEFRDIAEYAAYHHEKLDGTGYPFHITAKDMKLGSRIMAVADIFTAITEDRPYRKGMSKEEIIELMKKIGDDKHLDSKVVNVLLSNYDLIRSKMTEAQATAKIAYEKFWKELN